TPCIREICVRAHAIASVDHSAAAVAFAAGNRVAGTGLARYVPVKQRPGDNDPVRFPMAAMVPTMQRTAQRTRLFDGKSVVLFTTCLGVFIAQLDTSVVNLALRHVSDDLSSNVSQLQWIVDAYNLAFASFLLTGGILGDAYGRRTIFIIGNILFALGTLVCGLAPDNATLIGGRALS